MKILCPIELNDECELYEFSLYIIRELHMNCELRITNRESASKEICNSHKIIINQSLNNFEAHA